MSFHHQTVSVMATRSQNGFVLIAALIFMILMTVLALSVANSTTAEERMARNFRDRELAFSAAEAALRDAKLYITGAWRWPYEPVKLANFAADCSGGLCESIYTARVDTPVDSMDFFGGVSPGNNARTFGTTTGSPAIAGVANPPRYMVEAVCTNTASTGPTCDVVFRITAQAQGRLATTRVVLQEVFRPPQKLQ